MLHGGTPKVSVIQRHVASSIGSPVNEIFWRRTRRPAAGPASRSILNTVGAAARLVISNASSASQSRRASNRPDHAPTGMPSASGAIVPCQRPWPHAGDDGQKYRSPGASPTP